ncbi:MAG: hypothetical protein H6Q20_1936 [Bacteroidetes bacterium]|nr:hypothetical protein [Bacteroidota bacterium]
MKHLALFLFACFCMCGAYSQTFTSSNLPIVVIATDVDPSTNNPYVIPDEPKVPATMTIIYHEDGSRNYLTDAGNGLYQNYYGKIMIEKRGSSSQWYFEKKPYGFTTYSSDLKTKNSVSLLGMPEENDWVLNSFAYDATYMRDMIAYGITNDLGHWAPHSRYCEVVINGVYKGLYALGEKIKVDKNRVDITKIESTDNAYPDITGGYIIKADKTTGGDPVAWKYYDNVNNEAVEFIYDYPKPADITSAQGSYIKSVFDNLQSRSSFSSVTTGYPNVIDVPTFIDFMLINEFTSNCDGYQISTYWHKDRKGKLRAGPVWDFNLTFGIDPFGWPNRSVTNQWQFQNADNWGPRFFRNLFANAIFKCYFTKRWKELNATGKQLNASSVMERINAIAAVTSEAAARDAQLWSVYPGQQEAIASLQTFMNQRIAWMNTQLTSTVDCSNVSVPQLVISKINYHPTTTDPDMEDKLEFIEITNNSDKTADLTGIYFRELGLTYRFPYQKSLLAHQKIFLASDSVLFKAYYGIDAFGQYARNLSNHSENLMLVDAYGNIIDQVEYSDAAPWLTEADGNGAFLQLTDLSADNSVAANWTAATRLTTDNREVSVEWQVVVYPNPATDRIRIVASNQRFGSYEITDLTGKKLLVGNLNDDNTIYVSALNPSIYLLKLYNAQGESAVRKWVKR